jgi:hypothetical protein
MTKSFNLMRLSVALGLLGLGACNGVGAVGSGGEPGGGDTIDGGPAQTSPDADGTTGNGGDPGGDPGSGDGSDGGTLQAHDAGTINGFVHPGVLVDREQLDFVKAKIAAKQAPWYAAYTAASNSALGSLSYTPHPRADVQCGPVSMPDIGCTDEKNDSAAAYTHALLWYYGGNAAHADKAIEIMNAWASTITTHELSNAPLESAWVGSLWPRAGEIIRYTYTGWKSADVTAFGNMLKKVYLPQTINGSNSNGNWELSMIEATIGIGVFLDDKTTFNTAVTMWKKRVPAYIYMSSDGANPVQPDVGGGKSVAALKTFWYSPTQYSDGLSQETCRDLGHVQYGFAAITNAAETARIQGIDLYSLESTRLAAGYEFHAKYLNGSTANSTAVCGVNLNAVSPDAMWEIAYNALANRLGVALPQTSALIAKIRPTGSDHHMEWETLTHAQIGSVGIH